MQRFVLGLIVIFVAFVSPALGKTLFSYTTWQGGGQPGQVSSITFPIQPGGLTHYYQDAIFLNDAFTQADVGKTVTITSATDSNFNAFASDLTDGIPDMLVFWFLPAPAQNISGQGQYKSVVIWGDQNDPRVDLHGDRIDSFSLTLDSLQINNSSADSSFLAYITLSANGVPEPATSTLILLLIIALSTRRFWRTPAFAACV